MSVLYKRYTSTQVLTPDVDPVEALIRGERYFKENFLRLLPVSRSSDILEVGCGYGKYLKILQDYDYKTCCGIDLSEEQVAYAKEKLGLSNVCHGDAVDWLSDKTDRFDCVLAIDVLEHLEVGSLIKLMERIAGALRPGGVLIVQVPNGKSPMNPIIYGDLTHHRAFTPNSLRQLGLHCGLQPVVFREIPPTVFSIKSAVQRLIWSVCIQPLLGLIFRMIHGKAYGGHIYSANIIACFQKQIKN